MLRAAVPAVGRRSSTILLNLTRCEPRRCEWIRRDAEMVVSGVANRPVEIDLNSGKDRALMNVLIGVF